MEVTVICAGVGWVPSMVAVSLIGAALIAYVWAALTGAVTVYAPYISEAGASPPQSGVFSLLLYFGSLLACATMLVRYVVVRNLNRCCQRMVDVLNVASLTVGLVAVFGNLIVSAYPVLTSRAIHNAGAYTMFLAAVLYMTLETGLTCCLCPEYYAKRMVWLRFSLTAMSVVGVIFTACYQYVGDNLWSEGLSDKPKHLREPGDPGFRELLISAMGEWFLVTVFLAFFLTFAYEFRRVIVTVDLFPLVCHMDEHIEVTRLRPHDSYSLFSSASL
ncbi:DNA damage-regulated autophagy modulator protein 1-like isoform X1 [Dermacentor albipictus]|uniref:DNA damage-regulated autophagy modulator protein 1-like isoform X1 n=1 Tax=Dermacentor albipictus TaxID=60249 RepID=UPI0031FC3CE3